MSAAGWVFMSILIVILIAVVVAVGYWIVSQQRQRGSESPRHAMSAREALDHRLVSGEISGEQYDELRHKLEGRGGAPPPAPPAAAPG